jgi:hypothetical protein
VFIRKWSKTEANQGINPRITQKCSITCLGYKFTAYYRGICAHLDFLVSCSMFLRFYPERLSGAYARLSSSSSKQCLTARLEPSAFLNLGFKELSYLQDKTMENITCRDQYKMQYRYKNWTLHVQFLKCRHLSIGFQHPSPTRVPQRLHH